MKNVDERVNLMAFAELIEKRRKEIGLSQRDIAKEIHVPDLTLSRWEKAEELPNNLTSLYDLSKKLNLDFFDLLMTLYPFLTKEYPQVFQIKYLLDDLSPKEYKHYIELLKDMSIYKRIKRLN